MDSAGFYLGGPIDPASGERTDGRTNYDPGDLTTHGVIVGMTGSGKTGLGVIFLEEALLEGIPTLIIDPKGDMTNLLLAFPDLLPQDFEPWVDPAEARKDDLTVEQLAAEKAALWKNGLGWWEMDGSRIKRLVDGADFEIYTPGSGAGVGINIIGSLEMPDLDWEEDAESLRDEIEGFVSGLLGLVGIDAHPISSTEHILLSNLIEHAWKNGQVLALEDLLRQVHRPPLRKLGVFEMDTFFPEKDRLALAMKLNGLIASPAFASWLGGPPLDIQKLLWTEDGAPRAAILYLAHLSEEERQFIVTLVLSKVVTWMRSQAGSGDLRAMVYMDEVFGYVPPTAQPPSKKPILTLLKQARAFGVGLLLSTQNPVDLDYKAMSNAGTWCIGRLQTERDKSRILEALKSATGATDIGNLDKMISGLDKRQFLLHSTRDSEPSLFTTRWALSYLAGPLTREQVKRLMAGRPPAATETVHEAAPAETVSPRAELAADETPIMPEIADGIAIYHLDGGAPWAAAVGSTAGVARHEAAIAARVKLFYDDTRAKVSHKEEWEAIFHPLDQALEPADGISVDYDDRDFAEEAAGGVAYVIPEARIDTKTYFRSAQTAIKNHLYQERRVKVLKNAHLKLYSRVEESETDFLERADGEAQRRADEETAELRDKYAPKVKRLEKSIDAAESRIAELEVDLAGRREGQLIDQAGALLGVLLGRRSTRSVTGSSRSRAAARSTRQRLQTAKGKAEGLYRDVTELESELRVELEEINDRWEDLALQFEEVEIGLEKTDITVSDIALVWIPVKA